MPKHYYAQDHSYVILFKLIHHLYLKQTRVVYTCVYFNKTFIIFFLADEEKFELARK